MELSFLGTKVLESESSSIHNIPFNVSFPVKFNFLIIPEFVQPSLETGNRLSFDYNIWQTIPQSSDYRKRKIYKDHISHGFVLLCMCYLW